MKRVHYFDLLQRAVMSNDIYRLSQIISQLSDAERTREILRAKGYGSTGTSASATAAQVPNAARKD